MARKLTSRSTTLSATRIQKREPDRIPTALPEHLRQYAAPGGASIFEVALTKATAEQVRRTREITGRLDHCMALELWHKTQNPAWFWIAFNLAPKLEDIGPDGIKYLRKVARDMFSEVVKQVCSLKKVQIIPSQESEEGIIRQKPSRPALPDVASILGLARPGLNLFQAAARAGPFSSDYAVPRASS